MKELKLKAFEVKDGRKIAKFLVKTGLKKTLFEIMFPQDNPNLPKNWIELRAHLQSNKGMSDADFKALQEEVGMDFNAGLKRYVADFPSASKEMGSTIVDLIIEIFADDIKYEETVELLSYLFVTEKDEIESLSINEVVELVKALMKNTGFFESSQPSTPVTPLAEEIQAQRMCCSETITLRKY